MAFLPNPGQLRDDWCVVAEPASTLEAASWWSLGSSGRSEEECEGCEECEECVVVSDLMEPIELVRESVCFLPKCRNLMMADTDSPA